MSVTNRLKDLGVVLPPAPSPPGHYRPCVVEGHRVETAGHLPLRSGEPGLRGKLGGSVDLAAAAEEARVATLNALASLQEHLGSLERIERLHSLRVHVASTPDFDEHHLVSNVASDLLFAIFGDEAGAHVRTTVGVSALPFDQTVEVELAAILDSEPV